MGRIRAEGASGPSSPRYLFAPGRSYISKLVIIGGSSLTGNVTDLDRKGDSSAIDAAPGVAGDVEICSFEERDSIRTLPDPFNTGPPCGPFVKLVAPFEN